MIIYWKSRDYQILYFLPWNCSNCQIGNWGLCSCANTSFSYTTSMYVTALQTRSPDMELGHWVTGSVGRSGHLSRPGHRVTGSSFWPGVRPEYFRFSKKAQDKDIKIYILVKIRPTVIEILTFNKRSSKFYFPEACKRQTAIKTGKPLAHCKRLSATQVDIWSSL